MYKYAYIRNILLYNFVFVLILYHFLDKQNNIYKKLSRLLAKSKMILNT